MRLILKCQCNNLSLPLDYRHALQAVIYANLSFDNALQLHDEGFKEGKKTFKYFTFSKIIGKYKIINKKIIYENNIIISIASAHINILNDLYENFDRNKQFILLNNIIKINKIIIQENKIPTKQMTYRTLSPVTLYYTDQKGFTHYLAPNDPNYQDYLYLNLQNKLKLLNCPLDEPFKIINISKIKRGIYHYKDVNYLGFDYIITIEASKIVHNILLDTGLGARNPAGFGMLEIYHET